MGSRVIGEFAAHLPIFEKSTQEMAGVLLGSVEDGVARIEGMARVPFDTPEASALTTRERLSQAFDRSIENVQTRNGLAPLKVIGWWCVRGTHGLDDLKSELKFHNQRFRRISDIFLVLTPEHATASGTLYARSGELPLSSHDCLSTKLTIPLAPTSKESAVVQDSLGFTYTDPTSQAEKVARWKHVLRRLLSRLRRSGPERNVAPHRGQELARAFASWVDLFRNRALTARAALYRAALWPVAIARRTKIRAAVVAGLLLLASGLCVGFVHFRLLASELKRQYLSASEWSKSELGMRIEHQTDGIQLRWNRTSESVASAKKAVLEIQDGGQKRTLELEVRDLAEGSIFYSPISSPVSFRLTLYRGDGSQVSDSVQVQNPENDLGAQEVATNHPAGASVPGRNRSRTDKSSKDTRRVSTVQDKTKAKGNPLEARSAVQGTKTPVLAVRQTKLPPADTHDSSSGEASSISTERDTSSRPQSVASVNSLQNYVPPRPANTVAVNASLFEPSLLAKTKEIDIEVTLDETGRVTEARILNPPEDVNPVVGTAVLAAAKQWTFYPAQIDGKNISSKHVIAFHFARS